MVNMISPTARRYARALLSVAPTQRTADTVADELVRLAAAISASAELRGVLANPAFTRAARKQALAALAGPLRLSETAIRFASLLVDRRRIADLSAIADRYHEMADEAAGRVRANVVTAVPLPADLAPRIEQALSGALARPVTLRAEVEPGVIGGVVAQVGSLLFDGSVRSELDSLRRSLKS